VQTTSSAKSSVGKRYLFEVARAVYFYNTYSIQVDREIIFVAYINLGREQTIIYASE